MSWSVKPKVIFITGPTASGKSELAIYLAKKLNGEIINADSRQVYKYLDVGSGKWDMGKKVKIQRSKGKSKINGVTFYLLSIAHPKRNYSLGRWLNDAHKAVRKIIKKGKVPIFCGGTILYLRAIKEGWILPKVKPDYKLRRDLEKKTNEELYKEIKKLDPRRAKELDPNNKRRLIRALEIIYALGKVPKIKKEPKYEFLIIAPKIEREKLFKRIKKRLLKRVPGIIKEIKKLRKIGLSWKRIISFGLEYKWFGLYAEQADFTQTKQNKIDADYADFTQTKQNKIDADYADFTQTKQNKIDADYADFTQTGQNKIDAGSALYSAKSALYSAKSALYSAKSACYKDILRFAKRQIRELRKFEVHYVGSKKEAYNLCKKFLCYN
jgi:tRNA dimethylallyltransferase